MRRRRTQLCVALAFGLIGVMVLAWPERRRTPVESVGPSAQGRLVPSSRLAGRLDAQEPLEGVLTGLVRSAAGTTVAGASVCAERRTDVENAPPGYDGFDRTGVATTRCTISRADGEFAFPSLHSGHYRIQAMEPTAGTAGASVQLEEAHPKRVELTLQEGATLAGRVLDAQGGAVVAAQVHALQRISSEAGQLANVLTTSDEAGAFRMVVMPGEVVLRVEAEGYADGYARAHAPAVEVDVALAPAARLLGRVVSAVDDEPVASAMVIATRSQPELILRRGRAVSDDEGNFAIDGLTDGAYDVVAEATGFYGASAERIELGVAEREASVRISVQPAVRVSGIVLTSPGRMPCAQAEVTIRGARSERAFGARATSDASGRISFENVPAGGYELNVFWRGRTTALPTLVVGAQSRDDLLIEVPEGVRLLGRVVDPQGGLVSRERVLATPLQDNGPSIVGQSDEHGRFELLGLSPGSYRLGTASAPSKPLVVEVTERGLAKEIVLERGAIGALAVKLRHEDGSEVASTWQVYVVGERVLPAQRSGDSYAFRSLPAGAHRVSAHDGVNRPVETIVELRDGEQRDLTLLVPRHAGVLRGRVIDEQGAPVADAWVSAYASGALPLVSTGRTVLTGVDGSFELEGVATSGRYTVEAHAAAAGRGNQSDVEPGRAALIRLSEIEPSAAVEPTLR